MRMSSQLFTAAGRGQCIAVGNHLLQFAFRYVAVQDDRIPMRLIHMIGRCDIPIHMTVKTCLLRIAFQIDAWPRRVHG